MTPESMPWDVIDEVLIYPYPNAVGVRDMSVVLRTRSRLRRAMRAADASPPWGGIAQAFANEEYYYPAPTAEELAHQVLWFIAHGASSVWFYEWSGPDDITGGIAKNEDYQAVCRLACSGGLFE